MLESSGGSQDWRRASAGRGSRKKYLALLLLLGFAQAPAFCQAPEGAGTASDAASGNSASGNAASGKSTPDKITPDKTTVVESKRVLWIIPNFRTSPSLVEYLPLTAGEKFKIASLDSFDRGTFALGVLFGAEAQLTRSNPSFGNGVPGYAHYFATAYADYVIGDYMTEAIFPVMLHQDPRYFRRGTGRFWSRLGYAAGQIFITHNDSGRTMFNFSEIAGNSAAVAISMAYYPENRDALDAVSKLGSQIGVDMASNILKEFWPDLERGFSRKHKSAGD